MKHRQKGRYAKKPGWLSLYSTPLSKAKALKKAGYTINPNLLGLTLYVRRGKSKRDFGWYKPLI